MISLTFGLFTQVSDSWPYGPVGSHTDSFEKFIKVLT